MVKIILGIIVILALIVGASAPFVGDSWPVAAQEGEDGLTCATPEPSGGSEMLRQSSESVTLGSHSGQDAVPPPTSPGIGVTFDGFDFDDNITETGGWMFIPPDPMGAAGTDRLIAVVNVMIEARDKTGILLWRDSLKDFFTTLTPANWLFDPKVVWDQYENRFLVVALEKVDAGSNPDPGNKSRILLAVSKSATPATATSADWYYTAINGAESIGGYDYWADYPGFEVDEEAVYITNNIYAHTPVSGYGGSRLWIVDKGVSAGFYGGGAASVTKYDPYASAGNALTTMPAQVYGAGGIDGGGSGGTYLVGYSGLTAGGVGGNEYVQVVRVDNPLGATAFTVTNVLIGDIENVGGGYGWPDLPDAPQLGSATKIEVNDRRALDAVWRTNRLWFTTTINPNSGSDAGQTTAHWFRLDTSAWPPTLDDQGDIGGEDIATNTYTFFPALAVNNNGNAKFGFSASAATIYAGAYATVHMAGDPPGTVQASETIRAGVDYYVRHFSGTRNRWGDFTGAALDPTNDNVVWLFNQYAITRGSGTPPEDGRWGTAWASNLFTTLTDHFKCYSAKDGETIGEVVHLEDQFIEIDAVVTNTSFFCNPVEKWHDGVPTPILNPDHHLTVYNLSYEDEPQLWQVAVNNQFGEQMLTVSTNSVALAVPTQKVVPGSHDPPVGLDHYLLYEVVNEVYAYADVVLSDQFGTDPAVVVGQAVFFANPVQKTHGGNVTEIENTEAHLVFYEILGTVASYPQVQVVDQFGGQTVDLGDPAEWLAVPSTKMIPVPVGDKAVSPGGYVQPGQTLDYTISYDNEGAETAFGVYVTDVLDVDLDDSTLVIGAGGTYDIPTRTITWLIGTVGPGAGGTLTFSANVRSDATPCTAVTNYATVYFPSVHEEIATNIVVNIVLSNLTISSTTGGTVTTPGEGAFPYACGTVVNLVATPDAGYQFGNWTGDVGTIADDEDATTTITMNDDYSITANFEKSGGCFIATAAYGTPAAEEIQILREFRDEYLLTNPVGQALVDLYYTVSPPIAEFITEHPSLKPIVRAGLVPALAISTVAVNTSPAEKMAIIGLVVLVSVAVAVWATRRRDRSPRYT